MRIVGKRSERPISFSASAALLIEGARFNDEMHRLPTGQNGFIPKGVFQFRSHAEANRQHDECLAAAMARAARGRA